jgi:hypothetical protein
MNIFHLFSRDYLELLKANLQLIQEMEHQGNPSHRTEKDNRADALSLLVIQAYTSYGWLIEKVLDLIAQY